MITCKACLLLILRRKHSAGGGKIIVKCKDKEVIRTFLSMETYNAELPLTSVKNRCYSEKMYLPDVDVNFRLTSIVYELYDYIFNFVKCCILRLQFIV